MRLELEKPLPIVFIVFSVSIPDVCVICDIPSNFKEDMGNTAMNESTSKLRENFHYRFG